MPFACNLTALGRRARLAVGVAILVPAAAGAWSSGSITAGGAVTLGVGGFALFEAVKGWCILVATLERLRRGLSRQRIVRRLLGSA